MHAKSMVQWKQMGCQLPHPLGMISKSNQVNPSIYVPPPLPTWEVMGHTIDRCINRTPKLIVGLGSKGTSEFE